MKQGEKRNFQPKARHEKVKKKNTNGYDIAVKTKTRFIATVDCSRSAHVHAIYAEAEKKNVEKSKDKEMRTKGQLMSGSKLKFQGFVIRHHRASLPCC